MAMAHDMPKEPSWIAKVLTGILTTDFCPWANRFVYWLKEPIGWFVLATAISVIVGLYVSPIGWPMAASLVAIMAVGMIWPLVAIYSTHCELKPQTECVHEDQPCQMQLTVASRIPIPIWGLAIEGFLDQASGHLDEDATTPTVALACVAPICTSDYSITVNPPLRGHYPIETPKVACSFPFGIWTARRNLGKAERLTVWPKVFPVHGTCPLVGDTPADLGEGQRGGRSGDFVGVRAYRRGDSAKYINWIASARTDALIVTERGGPQCVHLDVNVDTRPGDSREHLADRIRVAASVLCNLHQSSVPLRVSIGSRYVPIVSGAKGRRQFLDALADVPADGEVALSRTSQNSRRAAIEITTNAEGVCVARVTDPGGGRRAGGQTVTKALPSGPTLVDAIRDFWMEVKDADVAA